MRTYNTCQFNKLILAPYSFFSQLSQPLLMLQCNVHVKMNKFLCILACTWMTIIDSQFNSMTACL